MNIKNYSLKVKKKILIDNCNLNFYSGEINHIVGKNGVGKSQLAKDFLLNNSGYIPKSIFYNTTLISNFSNIPNDVSKEIFQKSIKNNFYIISIEIVFFHLSRNFIFRILL